MTAVTDAIKTFINKMNPSARIAQLGTIIQTAVSELNTATANITAIKAGTLVYGAVVTATIAEINAGKVLVAAVTGKKIRPLSYRMAVNGGFASGTDIKLQDDNDTPVVVTTALTAALTNGAVIGSWATVTNVTPGAGLTGDLTVSKNLKVVANGTFTGGTSITFLIKYQLV